MTMSSPMTSGGKSRGPVYFSKFTLTDYKKRDLYTPTPPTRRDFINAATKLRPTAEPFFPKLKLNPSADEFEPKITAGRGRGQSFVVVRSVEDIDVEARIPVDQTAPVITLADLKKYFPRARGLFFTTGASSQQRRLISVVKSCGFSQENRKIMIRDVEFLLPRELERTYYVLENLFEEKENCSDSYLFSQVADTTAVLQASLRKLSHIRDCLKIMQTRAKDKEQMCGDSLDESGFADFDLPALRSSSYRSQTTLNYII